MKTRIGLVLVLTLLGSSAAQAGPLDWSWYLSKVQLFDGSGSELGLPVYASGPTQPIQFVWDPAARSVNVWGTIAYTGTGALTTADVDLVGYGFRTTLPDGTTSLEGLGGFLTNWNALNGVLPIAANTAHEFPFAWWLFATMEQDPDGAWIYPPIPPTAGVIQHAELNFYDVLNDPRDVYGQRISYTYTATNSVSWTVGSVTSVPDPGSSLLLLVMSLAGLRAWKRRHV